jgi:hypothetical protein
MRSRVSERTRTLGMFGRDSLHSLGGHASVGDAARCGEPKVWALGLRLFAKDSRRKMRVDISLMPG